MSIMLPPDSQGNNRGWRADDLTPDHVAPLMERFGWYHEAGEPDACWIWAGTHLPTGYGYLPYRDSAGRQVNALAHRVAWVAAAKMALTNQLTIDHLCVNTLCVNPAHLEPVTLSVNAQRRNSRRSEDNPYPRLTPDEIAAARARAAARVAILKAEKIARDRAAAKARKREPVSCSECGRTVQRKRLAEHLGRQCRAVGRPRKASA